MAQEQVEYVISGAFRQPYAALLRVQARHGGFEVEPLKQPGERMPSGIYVPDGKRGVVIYSSKNPKPFKNLLEKVGQIIDP